MSTRPPTRRRRILRALALTVLVTVVASGCDAYSTWQETTRDLVNDSRANNGRQRLPMNLAVANKAQAWAEHLAACHCLEHSNLAQGVPGNWRSIAENVGRGGTRGTLPQIHQAFLNSSGHRQNMMGQWSVVGIGVAARGTEKFVVHVFVRY